MVKLNEALLVGISLLAALVFSKGREFGTILPTLQTNNSDNNLLDQAQAQNIVQAKTNIETLQNIQNEILDYEKNISNVKINQLQTELDKTQSFISEQQRFTPVASKRNVPVRSAVYADRFGSESYNNLLKLRVTDLDRELMSQQSQYETAQQNIAKANELLFRQQGEIDRLQEEYQTRYGNLSRYG
jgi:hypothetical protein